MLLSASPECARSVTHSRYEPWIIVDRVATPYHDMRFRGFGMNKISHIESLNASGYTFLVHPQAFIVHRPHPRSSAKEQFNDVVQATTSKSNNLDFVGTLWGKCNAAMKKGTYLASVHPATMACRYMFQ